MDVLLNCRFILRSVQINLLSYGNIAKRVKIMHQVN